VSDSVERVLTLVMRPRNFHVAVAMRLGLPVLEEEKSCSLCMQTIDVFGDHAACCTKSADRIHRHNRVRNLIDKICHEGMLSPVMEKKGLLGDVDGRRPVMLQFQFGGPTKASPSTSQLPLPSASTICHAKHPARVMRSQKSMPTTIRTSKVLRLILLHWFLRRREVLMKKVSACYANCFDLLPSTKGPS